MQRRSSNKIGTGNLSIFIGVHVAFSMCCLENRNEEAQIKLVQEACAACWSPDGQSLAKQSACQQYYAFQQRFTTVMYTLLLHKYSYLTINLVTLFCKL